MSDAPKCEPPEELRGVDGLHWVTKRNKDGEPVWWISTGFWSFSGWSMTPKEAAKMGYRYLSPVLTPTEASAIREERDAAEAVKQSLTTELDERRRQYKDDMHAAIVEVGRWSQRSGQLEAERDAIALAFQKLGAVLRVNMLRWAPDTSHAEIDSAIDACLGPAARAALTPEDKS